MSAEPESRRDRSLFGPVTWVYLVGLLGVGGYTTYGIARGEGLRFTVLWATLTLAWMFGYWAVVTPIRVLLELRRLYRTVSEEYRRTGKLTVDAQGRAFLIEQCAEAASRQTPVPAFAMEWIVERVFERLRARAERERKPS